MKKIFMAALVAVIVVSMTGCGGKAEQPVSPAAAAPVRTGTYTPGTYSASKSGMGGLVPVSVTFSADRIESVTIGNNSETPGIATPVLESFPGQIVEGQTLNIDTVAGATLTSNAVIDAVADAVTQAGGDAQTLRTKQKTQKTAGAAIEKTADVVVIGGGGAGLAAATSASERGVSVILLEKGLAVGGNTLRAGGAYNAVDPARQKNIPMDASQITELKNILTVSPSSIHEEYRPTLAALQKQITEYLKGDTSVLFDTVELHTYQTYIGGLRTGLDGETVYGDYELVSQLTENSLGSLEWLVSHDTGTGISDSIGTVLGGLWPRMHSLTSSVGHGFIDPLQKSSVTNGTEIMLDTRAYELVVENGRVIGVKAEKSDGTQVTVYATKGLVLATGGYGANPAMAIEYDNYWGGIQPDMPTTNTALSTGDGIVMGKAVNANLVGMGYIQMMPSSQPVTGSLGGGLWGSAEDQVFVNKEGRRFVSEYESRDVLAKAALQQTDGMFYIICDQESAGNPQPGGKNGWGNDIDDLIETGSVLKADTLEGLAGQIGADPAVFVAEIERYNAFTKSGVDTDFQKVKIGAAIDIGPFYATPRTPSIHHTMGGLEINALAQVIDVNGKVIPGLFAAGEVAGGIHAGNRVGGNALPDIITYGRIAGENAAAGI